VTWLLADEMEEDIAQVAMVEDPAAAEAAAAMAEMPVAEAELIARMPALAAIVGVVCVSVKHVTSR
jgi:hypothetical protein